MGIFEFILALLIFGCVVTALLVVLAVWGTRKFIRWFKNNEGGKQLPEGDGAEVSPQEIQTILRRHFGKRAVGTRARSASIQLKAAEEKQAHLTSVIESKFPVGTLSWSKYKAAVDTAHATLVRNCTLVANRANAFDIQDYQRLERAKAGLPLGRNSIPEDVQQKRWIVMDDTLRTMDEIIEANEQLLLELDKLSLELGFVGHEEADVATSEILEEIQTLTEQAKLYQ